MSKNKYNTGNNDGNTEMQDTDLMQNIASAVEKTVDGNADTRKISNMLRDGITSGEDDNAVKHSIDVAVAGILGYTNKLVVSDETEANEDAVVPATEANAIDTQIANADENAYKNNYWDTVVPDTTDVTKVVGANTSDLLSKLDNIGLLKTINKLASTQGLSKSDIERASITLHMLINGLSLEQATVVNKFYNDDVDIMQYVDGKFSAAQLYYIGSELKEKHDVTVICKNSDYTVSQMIEIQISVHAGLDTSYVDVHMTPAVLGVLRKATILGIDISDIAEAAKTLDAMQVEMLVNLKYFGVDVSAILKNKNELAADKLFETLQTYYTKRNDLTCELAQDYSGIVKLKV